MKHILTGTTMLLLPMVASAQFFGPIDDFFFRILGFIDGVLVPLVFALALLVFIYGMFQYFILAGGSEEGQKKGKQLALWAIIGFVLMVSVWGIVNILAGGLFGYTPPPTLPGTPGL